MQDTDQTSLTGLSAQVVEEMGKQDRALLVQFVTGTSKVPLDGFRALQVRSLALVYGLR